MHRFVFYNSGTFYNNVTAPLFGVMVYYYHNIFFGVKSNKPKFNDKTKYHKLITNYELRIMNYELAIANYGENRRVKNHEKGIPPLMVAEYFMLPLQGDWVGMQLYPGRCPGLVYTGLSARKRL